MSGSVPILLDCDPGIDDAIAILTAAHHGHLVGITTVNGNAGIDHTTHNALITTQIAGIDVPVHRGAARPLVEPPLDAARIHGPTGLGTVDLPPLDVDVVSEDAPGFISEMARRIDGLHLVAVGPLTNVALALARDPDLPDLLAGVTIMGGAAQMGNVTAAAEFNIWADPEAAAITFRDAAPVTMVGLDLTQQIVCGDEESGRIRDGGTAGSQFTADLLDFYIARNREQGRAGASVHDAYAVLVATHPQHFEIRRHPVEIETGGRHTRGMTVVDRKTHASGPVEADVVVTAEAGAVVELMVEAATAF